MKKFYKVCLIICLLFTVAGAGCIIAAAAMGFSFTDTYHYVRDKVNGYSGRYEDEEAERLEFPKDKVKKITIKGRRDGICPLSEEKEVESCSLQKEAANCFNLS